MTAATQGQAALQYEKDRLGGSAFPRDEIHDQNPWEKGGSCRHLKAEEGMSLRDYFAAKAMQVFLAGDATYAMDAERAYKAADAMLEARKEAA